MILPLRLWGATLPRRISAIIRKPSYLSSKTQPGSSNGASVSVASIGCKRFGRGDGRLIQGPIRQSALRNAWTSFNNEGTLKTMACSVRRRGKSQLRDVDYRSGRAAQTDGEKTEDLPDFAGLFRSGDGRSLHEGGTGSVGR